MKKTHTHEHSRKSLPVQTLSKPRLSFVTHSDVRLVIVLDKTQIRFHAARQNFLNSPHPSEDRGSNVSIGLAR